MKRLLDTFIVLGFLPVWFPVMIIISFLSRLFVGPGIFFTQERPGLECIIFRLYKFRTMNNNLDMHGKLLPDSERITRFGSFLRSSSLDELPSLLNVLIGDMSLVGPRPLLVEYLERYDANQMKRHNVRPGITGLAQINGRNNITWDEKFTYDVEYVEKQNIILDFSILFKTVLKVISKSDINSSLEETMPTFKGTKKNG
jgi:lipopolysaccharide/colanic/teichoic acid biosynthesis glycosyltransferase